MTDKDIVKAAECCLNGFCSSDCPLIREYTSKEKGISTCLAKFCEFIIEKSKQPDENICDNPTTITQEAAIDRLHELGWLQKHDKELTETNIRIGYDAAIMRRANIAEVIEQVRREHKRNTKNESDYDNSKENDEAIPEWASGLYDKFIADIR